MTNDRAVEILNAIIFMLGRNYDTDEVEEAIHMAIEALKAQDLNKQVTGKLNFADDTISRQAAIEAVEFGITYAKAIDVNTGESKELFKEGNDALKKASERIKDLPSAQPETAKRIVGKSRDGMTLWYQCDMCNEPVDVQDNFCRGCGRRLTDE